VRSWKKIRHNRIFEIAEFALRRLNYNMKKQGRKIIMIVGNCPAHPHIQSLENIELPNTTYR
jgi:hypothetical protein